MKQIKAIFLLFFVNIFVVIVVNGQNLIVPGKTWIYLLTDENPYSKPYNDECLRIGADTLISNTNYHKLMYSLGCDETNWRIDGFIRETEDSLVFYCPNYSSAQEFLLYDFGIQVGDSVYVMPNPSRLDSIGKTSKGQKIYYLSGSHNFKDRWIDGVGSEIGLLMELTTGGSQIFSCCLLNGKELYHNPNYSACFYTSATSNKNSDRELKVHPNPVSGELFVHTNQTIDGGYTLELYSVKGELVKTECLEAGSNLYRFDVSSLRNGIYILRLISDSGKYDEETIIKE